MNVQQATECIKKQQQFAVVKFNDGEWYAMRGKAGSNCDNHKYTKRLGWDLRRTWRWFVEKSPETWLSNWINAYSGPLERKLARKIGTTRHTFWHAEFLHCIDHPNIPAVVEFYHALAEDSRKKVFVCPQRLQTTFFGAEHVTVPLLNAYRQIGRIDAEMLGKLEPGCILMLACGFSSCVLARSALQLDKSITVVDIGSGLDNVLWGRTRKSQIDPREIRKYYSVCPKMAHFYQEIPGWFNFERLYLDAVRRASDDAHFVEVGVWQGKSTAFLATEIYNSGKRIRLDAVDHFKGSAEHRNVPPNLAGVAANNLRAFDFCKLVKLPSLEASKQYEDASLDFVFLDGSHDYANVRADITAWRPKVKPGGMLAGHDYGSRSFPGVRKAVDELVPDRKTFKNSWFSYLQSSAKG